MRSRTVLCLTGALGLQLVLQSTGCAQSPPPRSTPAPVAPADAAQPAPNAANDATPSPELLELVRADAARILGVSTSRIEIITTEAVVWADGGLGCARPDEMVTMVQTPGFRLRLRSIGGERVLVYHTNRRAYFRLCPGTGLRPLPPPTHPDR